MRGRGARRRDASWNPHGSGGDSTGLFAVLIAVPLVLPLIVQLSFLLFLVPLVLLAVGAARAFAVARHRAPALGWRLIGTSCAAASAASALGAAAAIDPDLTRAALVVGAAASVLLVVSAVPFLRRALSHGAHDLVVDALLIDGVVASLAAWFVVRPGLQHGDVVLTLVFAADIVALVLVTVAAAAAPTRAERSTGAALMAAVAAASIGDGVVARGGSAALTALMWGVAAVALLVAVRDRQPGRRGSEAPADTGYLALRILLPLGAALSFPLAAAVVAARGELTISAAIYFAAFFVATLILAFGRQARLLLDNQRSVMRERRLRGEVVRRNEELQALTALATTMTETLEEDPVVERGLAALRVAARPTSMALHLFDGDRLALRATAGDWSSESAWALRDPRPGVEEVGGRQLVHLPVSARGHDIGLVTLVRGADDPLGEEQLDLLRLLVDQVAIAIHNARDYRTRLEQATRDPLTGVYNRRFFFEALATELARSERSGSTASLVIVDVDDFKQVNDTLGHTAGDEVLCAIARIAGELVRPADSFARIGGEEFALLLPETSQLEALLVAERLRRGVASAKILTDRAVTVSAGVASFPDDATTLEELEAKADAALYWSKRNGKNLCAVASEVVVAEDGSQRDAMLTHLHALVSAIDAEHLKTRDHSENVAAYAAALGGALGLSPERLLRLRRAALFHDIGKIAVRADILAKPSALSDEEYAEMKTHSVVGASMLAHAGFGEEATWVRQHHERIDGRGYPDGIAGGAIAFEARIIFVADSFEAMTSDRPYRAGMPVADAVEELRRCSGSQFDPRVVDAMAGLLERDELPVLALRAD
jgi:diguanylate cyclase (GGDEF)-like protein/putative nucleotidyltransferase with HDIG domain